MLRPSATVRSVRHRLPWLFLSAAMMCPTVARADEKAAAGADAGKTDSAKTDTAKPDAAGLELFEKKIRPVLVEHCQQCHAGDSKPLQGGLRVDFRDGLRKGGESGPAVVPGKPGESLIIGALKYDGLQMPPKGKLGAAVVADFEKWIALGAPDPRDAAALPAGGGVLASTGKKQIDYAKGLEFWAFKKPVATSPPAVKDAAWPRNDIDRFVLAKLEAAGLSPSEAADRRTLIRRATFDLIGLPPTPEEVEAFVRDESPDAWDKVVDRLLDSPHYGERQARRWLDVARYGEDQAHTFKARNYPQGWRYRDWVVKAFNDDMPYDRFLKLQIAGDLLDAKEHPEHMAALGLFALGPVYYQDNGEMAKALADEHDDRLDTLARGVWGLTLACARCHDHKFDPLSMHDYYALLGVFSSSQYQERPVVPAEVLNRKTAAEGAMKEQQLKIDQMLVREARSVRPGLAAEVGKYVVAGWVARNRMKSKPNDKKLTEAVAKEQNVSEFLLKRWVDALDPSRAGTKPWLKPYVDAVAGQDAKADLSRDETALAAVRAAGEAIQTLALEKLPRREALFAQFGENVAFVKQEDLAQVPPGMIPLGNLFDDVEGVSLASAVASDKFKAAASNNSLGVDRIAQGWGEKTDLAAGIHFDFQKLGADGRSHGAIVNDAWDAQGGLRTKGERFAANGPRAEQGIGMHANALITFDLHKIRQAGLLPADQRLRLKVDRAGFNDDTFGGAGIEAHVAVIVSKPHAKQNVYDAIVGMWVNGTAVKVEENDMTYYIAGDVPAPMKPDGKFASFDIPLPADARYVTLVAAAAGKPDQENSINSDHTVFSGARLEFDPLPGTQPAGTAVAAGTTNADDAPAVAEIDPRQIERDRADALLLSELLYDQGLLALPPAECEKRLTAEAAKELVALRQELEVRKKASDAIAVPMAHSLNEGASKDHPLYLLGNPKKPGDAIPRSIPAIFTAGKRQPFDAKGSGRLELAEAVASADNPLTARVMVNRVWASHFGHGLVRTPSNFGALGEPPTHPELLDWLAMTFQAGVGAGAKEATAATPQAISTASSGNGAWSVKALQRLILRSATYRQTSAPATALRPSTLDPQPASLTDPENRLLWQMNRQRLEVEPWRDAILAITGELDRTVGGPSIELGNAGNNRRTLYSFISRHRLDDLLRLFDFPDPNITSDRRSVTTVPLQQLFVLNSAFMASRAKALVKRLNEEEKARAAKTSDGTGATVTVGASTSEANESDRAKLFRAFQLAFNRPPGEAELKAGLEFVSSPHDKADTLTPWEQYALALLGANELLFVD